MALDPAVPGSLPLGFLAGFFGGCLGLIIVWFVAKGAATRKGAIYGLIAQFVLGIVFGVIVPMISN